MSDASTLSRSFWEQTETIDSYFPLVFSLKSEFSVLSHHLPHHLSYLILQLYVSYYFDRDVVGLDSTHYSRPRRNELSSQYRTIKVCDIISVETGRPGSLLPLLGVFPIPLQGSPEQKLLIWELPFSLSFPSFNEFIVVLVNFFTSKYPEGP